MITGAEVLASFKACIPAKHLCEEFAMLWGLPPPRPPALRLLLKKKKISPVQFSASSKEIPGRENLQGN